jgi:predicted acylesterase/phospholipase RssA
MRTEVRLALVLNGGVSLAVWMGGVVHELDLARRASLGLDPPSDPLDAAVFEHWKQVCDLAGITLRVDVIAGTSAGGLNGAFLAEAIANGHALPNLREVWLKAGSLAPDTLLRVEDRASVLSGSFFEEQIDAQLGGMPDVAPDPSVGEPVTLFVTATGLSGGTHEMRDAFGSRFSSQDHRRLFRFAKQEGTLLFADGVVSPRPAEHHFTRAARPALKRAARASAGFPGAFAPVDEAPLLPYRTASTPPDTGTSALMDGGVLDNAPFGPVLAEVGRLPVDGPYRRVVGYIVPSSGPLQEAAAELPYSETKLTRIIGSTVQMPREADFRDDVEELIALSRDSSVDSQARLIHLQLGNIAESTRMQEAASRLIGDYGHSALAAAVLSVRTLLGTEGPTVLAMADVTLPPSAQIPSWLPTSLAAWRWTPESALRALRPLLREVQQRLLGLQDPIIVTPMPELAAALATAQQALDLAIRSTRAVAEAVTDNLLASAAAAELDVEVLLTLLEDAHDAVRPAAALGGIVSTALEAYADALLPGQAQQVLAACVAAEVVARTGRPSGEAGYPSFDMLRIGPDVASPLVTADALQDLGSRKLYGTTVGHFGGFLDEDWRRWDFLWGRLDGTAQLMRLLAATDLAAHQRLVLAAEKTTETALLDGLAKLSDAKNDLVAEKLRTSQGQAIVRNTLQAILRVLLRPDATPPPKGWRRLLWVAATGAAPHGVVETVLRWLMKPARNAASSSYSDPAKLPKRVLVWALVPVAALLVAVGLLVGIAIGLLVG